MPTRCCGVQINRGGRKIRLSQRLEISVEVLSFDLVREIALAAIDMIGGKLLSVEQDSQ